jgi:hypothetical protein
MTARENRNLKMILLRIDACKSWGFSQPSLCRMIIVDEASSSGGLQQAIVNPGA